MAQPLLDGNQFLILFGITAAGTLAGWLWFFYVIKGTGDSIRHLVSTGSFLQNLTVILVVLAVTILSAARILTGELAATLLSGIVGYVLGSVRGPALVLSQAEGAAPSIAARDSSAV